MSLKKYWEKKVIIESFDKDIYRGFVSDYVYPEDNENRKESIIIDAEGYGYPLEFQEDEIKSIEVMR